MIARLTLPLPAGFPTPRGAREQGRVEGQAWLLDHRHVDGDPARGGTIIRDIAALPVDASIVPGPAAARAEGRATAIPLVAIGLLPMQSDPELSASLARPGGSVTGCASFGEETSAERVEVLRETIAGLATVGVPHEATDPAFDAWGRLAEASANAQGLPAIRVPLASRDVTSLAAAMRERRADAARAAVVVRDCLTRSLIAEVVAARTAEGIAVIGDQAPLAEAGALFSYGASVRDLFRRVAVYVVRILRGEKPGDLPVQLPTAIEFVVSLRTARALGPTVPHTILARAANNATRVILGALRHRGFGEGQSVVLRAGAGEPVALLRALAELVALDPGVLIAVGAPAVFAAARQGGGRPDWPYPTPGPAGTSRGCSLTSPPSLASGSTFCWNSRLRSGMWCSCGRPRPASTSGTSHRPRPRCGS